MKHPVDIFKNVLDLVMINSYQIQKDCKTKPLYQPLISNNFENVWLQHKLNWKHLLKYKYRIEIEINEHIEIIILKPKTRCQFYCTRTRRCYKCGNRTNEVIQKCIWYVYVCFTFYCEKTTKKQICYIKHKIKFKFSIYPKWFFFTFFERKMCILYTKIIDLGFWKKVQV